MEQVSGIASELSARPPVRDANAGLDKRSRAHVLYFRLDGRPIKFLSPHKPTLKKINDGDQVIVVGTASKNGLIEIIAFKNLSTGLEYSGWKLWLFGGALFSWLGIHFWIGTAQSTMEIAAIHNGIFSSVFLFFGIVMLFFSAQALWAVVKLRKTVS